MVFYKYYELLNTDSFVKNQISSQIVIPAKLVPTGLRQGAGTRVTGFLPFYTFIKTDALIIYITSFEKAI
jgi:hypothetical protein